MSLEVKALALTIIVGVCLVAMPHVAGVSSVILALLISVCVFIALRLFFIKPFKKNQQRLDHDLKVEKTQRRAAESELASQHDNIAQLAQYDQLTSLPNRFFFNESLNRAMMNAKRHKKILAVLSIKLDAFNQVAAALGQSIADGTIKEIGARLSNALRSDDILARLEGDEFIILLQDIGKPKFASIVAKKILLVCSMPIKINTKDVFLQASIGICIYPNDGDSLENLLKNVNTALDTIFMREAVLINFIQKKWMWKHMNTCN